MLSIIVTHYKTPALLKLCLRNISKYCGVLDYEIIVADSEASSYNKLLAKEIIPKSQYIGFKENIGYAKLVNAGIRDSRGDFILVINADIVVVDDSIQTLINFMEEHPEIGLAGPQLLNFNNKPQQSCFRFYTPFTILYRRTFWSKLPLAKRALDRFLMKEGVADLANKTDRTDKFLEVDWLMGSALMARREAVEKVGFMDEKFFMYFEDVDWAKRFWIRGYKVAYFPKSKMYHYHQKVSSKRGGIYDIITNKYTRAHIKSAFRYFWKHGIFNRN